MAKRKVKVELYEHDDDLCGRGCGRGCSRNQFQVGWEAAQRHAYTGQVEPLIRKLKEVVDTPIEMILWCPECGERHIDVGDFAKKVHHTHACQHCGMVWRPCVSPTVGVQFLPGFKNAS